MDFCAFFLPLRQLLSWLRICNWRGEFNMLHTLWFALASCKLQVAGCRLSVVCCLLISWLLPQTARWHFSQFVKQELGEGVAEGEAGENGQEEKVQLNSFLPLPHQSNVQEAATVGASPANPPSTCPLFFLHCLGLAWKSSSIDSNHNLFV